MVVFLTGGTGFIGAHVARALLARGEEVRCLVRPGSFRSNLAALDVRLVEGDLTSPEAFEPKLVGVDILYHCAADYRLDAPDPSVLYRVNVDGTDRLLAASARAGVGRVVYTSSVGALGLRDDGLPADEETPVRLEEMVGHYKRSKFVAEQVARRWAEQGLDVVIVNPSAPIGALDVKPTPTGQMVLDYLRGRMKAVVDTGLNLIDVEDVAEGHLLAAEKGRRGERYILGHRNMSLEEIFSALEAISGVRAPRLKLPHWIPLGVAAVDSFVARLRDRPPQIPLEGVRMARHHMYFDASKAVRELGLPQRPVEEALAKAVAWFGANGARSWAS